MFELGFNLGIFLLLMLLGYLAGSYMEKGHYRRIRARELEMMSMPAVNFRSPPANWNIESGILVTGSVVVSVDYFKRFLAGLRILVGGRLKSYESLLDRGRREALLRMKDEAVAHGCQAIINVRLETSRIAGSANQGTAGVEILAFGTAVKLAED